MALSMMQVSAAIWSRGGVVDLKGLLAALGLPDHGQPAIDALADVNALVRAGWLVETREGRYAVAQVAMLRVRDEDWAQLWQFGQTMAQTIAGELKGLRDELHALTEAVALRRSEVELL